MKPLLFFAVLASLLSLVLAWDKLDHEIFELYDDIKQHESTTDWYDFLAIKPKATVDEINKAYRQLSKKYHPDKLQRLPASAGKASKKRFQRIGLVVNILRDAESRKRYNFFRKNGVPMWRGTGYLYSRWRPGFGTVVVGLLMFVSGMQFLFQWLSFWRAQQRIEEIEEESKRNGGKVKLRRRQDRPLADGEVPVEDNATLVNTEGVINPYTVKPPAVRRLLIVSLPVWMATEALAAVGLYKKPVVEDAKAGNTSESEDDELRAAIDSAVQSADDSRDVAAHQRPTPDPEVRAKKAAKKAVKTEARRRRTPVV